MELNDIEVGVVFQVYRISISKTERETEVVGYYLNENVGLQVTRGKGYFNSGGTSNTINCVKLRDGNVVTTGNKVVDINSNINVAAAKKEVALAKLTEEEKALLGL